MRRQFTKLLATMTVLALALSMLTPTFAVESSVFGGTAGIPIIEERDVEILDGAFYDLSNVPGANEVYGLTQGTVYVEFQSTGDRKSVV